MNHSTPWPQLTKYDRPGPRYTSYPTAPCFSEDLAADDFLSYLQANRLDPSPLSLYVHVPFCKHLCWYCGCNMRVSRNQQNMNRHTSLICREMDLLGPHLHPGRRVNQIHFGGGTPNYLSMKQLGNLVHNLRTKFLETSDCERSIELDPRHLTEEQAQALAEMGFNRVSMGIQDLDPKVQKAINRHQPMSMVMEAMAQLRKVGLSAVNMDLIYGLPNQNPDSFAQTVNQVIAMRPSRIALFNYAYVPKLKPHMNLIRREALPNPTDKYAMLRQTAQQLIDAGYVFIGMDHFAEPDDPLAQALAKGQLHRNFQGYTTCPESEMVGFGMSAISMLDGLYVQNTPDLKTYEAIIRSGHLATHRGYLLNLEDRLRRTIISNIMCGKPIDPNEIELCLDRPFECHFPGVREALDDMVRDDLLEKVGHAWHFTFQGRFFMRNVAMLFDSYLPKMLREKKASFSRTV